MSVGIVIVNWNGKELLDDFLSSIGKHTQYGDYEVIVVDNNSDDDSVPYIREKYPETNIIALDSNLGYVGGLNEAVLRTRHDAYFLANNDCIVHTGGWLTELMQTLESDARIGIVGPNNDPDAPSFHGGQYWDGSFAAPDTDTPTEVDLVSGAQMLVDAAVFDNIGLIDEKYWPAYNEELDFCYRAQENGWRVMFDPRVCVEHLEGMTVDEDVDKFETGRRHDLLFRWQNYSIFDLMKSMPQDVKQIGASALMGPQYLYRNIRAYGWAIRKLPSIVEGRLARRDAPEMYGYWLQRDTDSRGPYRYEA